MAAARLQHRLGLRERIESRGGNVDVFGAIQTVDLPLLLRPLQGLLGAYLSEPAPGVLVTTQRPMSIQRFTAAHELGHFSLRHQPSLDDESILRRMPMTGARGVEFQEVEADAFAVAFMMPRWLIGWHAGRQAWTIDDFRRPNVVYQLSLRIGASLRGDLLDACTTSADSATSRARVVEDSTARAESGATGVLSAAGLPGLRLALDGARRRNPNRW
jgi:hypothetical protein